MVETAEKLQGRSETAAGSERWRTLSKGIGTRLAVWFSVTFMLVLALVELVSIYGLIFTTYSGRQGQQREEAFASLDLIADLQKERLERWLEERRDDARVGAESLMIVGIVAGIALPNIRSALFMAEAVHIVSDVSTIRLAAYTYLSETGDFPSSGGFGIAPPQLANHLPDGFPFTYKNVEYAFWSFNLFGGGGFWGTKKLGIVMVSFPN